MTELKFNGPATITGFPRDKAFGFEVEGDVLLLKAGKDVFLRVEKEPAPLAMAEYKHVEVSAGVTTGGSVPRETLAEPAVLGAAGPGGAALTQEHAEGQKERKPRGPNITIDENSIIVVDLNLANPYSKLRGKYYETLKTAHGRTVAWWRETSMVKSLEGSPMTMLKFFLSEKVIGLQAPVAVLDQPAQQAPVAPVQPGFSQGPAQSPQPVAGALWTPPAQPGQAAPGQSGGPTFM